MSKRLNIRDPHRAILLLMGTFIFSTGTVYAAGSSNSFISLVENPSMETNFILLGMALVQVIIILALSGIIKTLGGNGQVWVEYLNSKRTSVILVPLFFVSVTDVIAAAPGVSLMSSQNLFWWLVAMNLVFFLIVVAQMVVLKGMVRTLSARPEEEVVEIDRGPSFADTVLSKLTRRADEEKERDILMHHEYDGIRELDNVLPPWWLWLFYGTIIWGVVYLVNVHVTKVWPDQVTEYEQEMVQAKADIESYLANAAEAVDENSVVLLTEVATLNMGNGIFQDFCKACHGSAGEGNAVGPNLTDEYWIHGGSINDLFRTIKYGVVEKGMQSWKKDLSPKQIQAVASYIWSLQGTTPPNAKEPQGELYIAPVSDAPSVEG